MDAIDEYVGPFVFDTDGRGVNELIMPAGVLRHPPTTETKIEKEDETGNVRCDENLYMNGAEIFTFSMETVPRVCNCLLEKAKMSMEDIDYFIFSPG